MDTLLMQLDRGLLASITLASLTFVGVYHYLKTYTFWSARGIKGPTPWPFVGTMGYYMFRNKNDVDREWYKKYGRTFGIYEGTWPVLRTTDCELIKHVFVKNFSSFTDRNDKFIFGANPKRWLFWSKGSHWANQRALISPIFNGAKMRHLFGFMSSCTNRFIAEISRRLELAAKKYQKNDQCAIKDDDEAIELNDVVRDKPSASASNDTSFSKDDFMAFNLDVISQSVFNIKLDTYKDKSSEFFKRAFAFAQFDVWWFVLWMFIPKGISEYFGIDITPQHKYEYFEKVSQARINELRRQPTSAKVDLAQALIDADLRIEEEKQVLGEVTFRKFDDQEIISQMTFFFLGAYETTSSSLSFCFYELAHQQDKQQELYRELMELVGNLSNGSANGSQESLALGDKIEYAQLVNLKKLDAFVSESLRLYSPVTEHNRQVTKKGGIMLPIEPDKEIYLPEGTAISVAGLVLQRDPTYWPEPLRFDMTRFYPENVSKIRSCSYGPFGFGPRSCVGARFALLQIRTCIAKILLNYKVLPGLKSSVYPPKFNQHAFFLQLENSDFRLLPRDQM